MPATRLPTPPLSSSHKWFSPSSTLTPPSASRRASPPKSSLLLPKSPADVLVPTTSQGGSSISSVIPSAVVVFQSALPLYRSPLHSDNHFPIEATSVDAAAPPQGRRAKNSFCICHSPFRDSKPPVSDSAPVPYPSPNRCHVSTAPCRTTSQADQSGGSCVPGLYTGGSVSIYSRPDGTPWSNVCVGLFHYMTYPLVTYST
jgi:hypothetical protein